MTHRNAQPGVVVVNVTRKHSWVRRVDVHEGVHAVILAEALTDETLTYEPKPKIRVGFTARMEPFF